MAFRTGMSKIAFNDSLMQNCRLSAGLFGATAPKDTTGSHARGILNILYSISFGPSIMRSSYQNMSSWTKFQSSGATIFLFRYRARNEWSCDC